MDAHERRALPEGWEWKRLGEVCDVQTGKKDVNEGNPSGKYYFFTCAAIPLLSDTYSFDGEAILLPGNGANVGLALYFNGKFEAYQRTYVLYNFKVNGKFIFYYLKKFWKKTLGSQYGSATNYIRLDNIINFTLPLPPLPTQRRIVSILEKAEETKRLRAQADELTERLLQSVFLEMFGDPVKNPMGWEKYKFKDVIQEFRYGTSIKSSEGGYPVLRIPNVIDGKINLNELKYCKVTLDDYEKLRLQEGDVLFVRTNGNQDYVGRCAVVEKIQKDFIFASYLIRAKLKQEIISPYYLKNYLFTGHGKNLVKSKTKTTAGQFNINTQGLGSVEILVSPLPLQQKFARIVERVESMRQNQNQSKKNIEDLFNTVMQKAFKGELTI